MGRGEVGGLRGGGRMGRVMSGCVAVLVFWLGGDEGNVTVLDRGFSGFRGDVLILIGFSSYGGKRLK